MTGSSKILYPSGPMLNCTDEECANWRSEVAQLWRGQILDPNRRTFSQTNLKAIKELVELDKIEVKRADVLLVYPWKPSPGTSMEMLYGWMLGKMIVTVYDKEPILSPWIKYHSHKVFNTIPKAIDYIHDYFQM